MIKNYLKIALRNLLKSKVHTVINITGLAVGLTSVVLISLYVQDETSFDQFHENADDIYRIAWWSEQPQTRTPHPMAQALVRDFPQVESAVSLSPLWGPGLTKQMFSVKNPENDITFDEDGILSVDSTFFEVFSFKLTKGDPKKVLRSFGGLLISESTAKKYFGDDDPIGKQLAINNDETLVFVEGVFEDVPKNSHFHFDALVSYVTQKVIEDGASPYYTWADFGHFNYIKLAPGSDPDLLENQLMKWASGYVEVSEEDMRRAIDAGMHFKLQRLTDIHLKSNIRWELESNGNVDYIYIMTAAALLILIIACVNFMNLTTARSTERSKEIGIRKSMGAYKNQLSFQFLSESVLTALIAMVLAGLLAEVCLPLFNYITDKDLSIDYLQKPELTAILLGSTILTGLISGLYPSLFLSSINPVSSLKGIDKVKPKGATFRKSLIIFQFVISMVLLTGSLVIYNQLQFIKNKDLGFDKDRVVIVPLKNYDLIGDFTSLKTELLKINGIESVSASSNVPGKQFNQNSIARADDPQASIGSSEVMVDYNFFETLGIEILAGRAFSKDFPTDSVAFIINETAARNLQLAEPVGEEIVWSWDNNGRPPLKGTIVGVARDFNYSSLHQPVRPLLFSLRPAYNDVIIKVKGADFTETLAEIKSVWSQFEDRFVFEYSLLADDMGQQYSGDQKTADVFSSFAAIAIFIACFGLFGIASLSYSQRLKEVGIRKALGASELKILGLLLKDFTRLIIVSILIAAPVAWLVMHSWLENFTYRVNLSIGYFLIAGLVLIGVALLTILYLSIKTANINPVETLKEQ
ncbi:FtsX-like permease family protein [Fulvivirga sp. RKSG066]|uniref:ABC transporter permease n=1 Tax=Fulvivirga aurantia TaxID=2529383 RepID=UPI0012BC914A|nr:ABC transporter permease [Fulvivirga aurantia]MTI21381.1 FtsX-like permease family protein [Fulvivirga aurantia]